MYLKQPGIDHFPETIFNFPGMIIQQYMIHLLLQMILKVCSSLFKILSAFPPKSVKLKKPFVIQPRINLEENIGILLMDSRLLGEIHVALLKLMIKDIEDVARMPSTGLGTNQNGAANPGGGHPLIVEGAYAWGFDIFNWQQHLNPLTWIEIFRQLALSAGFGPQLRKRSITWSYPHENDGLCKAREEDPSWRNFKEEICESHTIMLWAKGNEESVDFLLLRCEGKSCKDITSTLSNGSAAENTFTVMQEKGLLLPRRSRHRLTPGTIKFAAFHFLSLEGGEGLTVLELADKIQKSGLQYLTTSKTLEASFSVALTRDAKLFERIAPLTYRVCAAFRKDPAEAILRKFRYLKLGF